MMINCFHLISEHHAANLLTGTVTDKKGFSKDMIVKVRVCNLCESSTFWHI